MKEIPRWDKMKIHVHENKRGIRDEDPAKFTYQSNLFVVSVFDERKTRKKAN